MGYVGQGTGGTPARDPGQWQGIAAPGQIQQQGAAVGQAPGGLYDQLGQLNALGSLYGPQMALAGALGQNQITGLEGQNFWTQQSLQNQINAANQGAYYQQAGLGLQGQSLGIQQGALSRQMAELPQQYGLTQQGFDIQGQRLGLQSQQVDLSQLGAWQGAAQQQRSLASQLTASGNPYSVGGARSRQDIAEQLQNQMTGFGLERQGIGLSQQELGLQRQGAAINYYEQTAAAQDAQKELGIQSQQLGLNQSEIKSRLDTELNNLGIQGQVSSDQLLQAISQVKQGMITPLGNLASMIGQRLNLPFFAGQPGG